MHMQPIYLDNDFVTAEGLYKGDKKRGIDNVGSDIFHRGLCLPSDIKMTTEDQDVVIATIRACFE